MKTIFAIFAVLSVMGGSLPAHAHDWPAPKPDRSSTLPVLKVADNCYAVGQKLAQKRGARLLRADAVGDGQCRVVMLVPDGQGGRPRREEVVVPMR
ncbi:hypothetical protein [Notoacmeibacter ruber]|nr:hypothetical protein [Notoacmeibacter ruber]